MEQQNILRTDYSAFISVNLSRSSFGTRKTRDSYALLARENNILAMDFAISGGKCAHFTKEDCFECLLPHTLVA